MEVRRFQADTIQEATYMVKRDLGSDALILSTRKLDVEKGASAYRTKGLFEISAMAGETRRDSTRVPPQDLAFFDALKSELMNIKEMLFLLGRSRPLAEGFAANPEAMDVYPKMIRSGISEPYVHAFLKKAGAFDEDMRSDSNGLHERVLKEVSKVIDITDPFARTEGQIVAALVGPTGVGKTTTIAKLVADLSLKQKRTVGLISIDNYRIGAMEQLKTYAAILGVPCFPAFSCADLQFALRRLNEKDVILIDTAGQSHYDMERMKEMAALVGSDRSIKSHLLLSTATSASEMDSAARNFGRLNLSSYIFTKTDETRARGVIVNQSFKLKMPISFITTGQRVPEDILKATRTGILSLIFQ
ncbi:MAG: protein FlhF [Proteobacteria bacterium]|nr:protein FlhF [Pseudomonadota bacterium]